MLFPLPPPRWPLQQHMLLHSQGGALQKLPVLAGEAEGMRETGLLSAQVSLCSRIPKHSSMTWDAVGYLSVSDLKNPNRLPGMTQETGKRTGCGRDCSPSLHTTTVCTSERPADLTGWH